MTFDEQVDAMLASLPRRHRVPFLAGVRFAAGHAEHGDSLFHKAAVELRRDEREETADRYTYRMRLRAIKGRWYRRR